MKTSSKLPAASSNARYTAPAQPRAPAVAISTAPATSNPNSSSDPRTSVVNRYLQNWDANDMLALMRTWQLGDISKASMVTPSLQGDLAGVLSTITAKGLIMPGKMDLYFPVRSVSFACANVRVNRSGLKA